MLLPKEGKGAELKEKLWNFTAGAWRAKNSKCFCWMEHLYWQHWLSCIANRGSNNLAPSLTFPGAWHRQSRQGRPEGLWPNVSVQAACPLKGNLLVSNMTALHIAASSHCRQELATFPFDNVSSHFSLPGSKERGKNIPLQVSASPAPFHSVNQTPAYPDDLWSVNKETEKK